MNLFNDYVLLIAVATPVLALVGLNIFLWLGGERGTLLLPGARQSFATLAAKERTEPPLAPVVDETPSATGPEAVRAPANDPHARVFA